LQSHPSLKNLHNTVISYFEFSVNANNIKWRVNAGVTL